MSSPAALAAVPGLIRATRLSVEEHAPIVGLAGVWRALLIAMLFSAEEMADCLAQVVPAAAEVRRRPPQQVFAPLADQVEPRVPRWTGHDPRLPPGQPHP